MITFTPRHRIVASREISRLHDKGELVQSTILSELYTYDGMDTCATCSLCSTVCPVGIDTGNLTKYLRNKQITPKENQRADIVANHFSTVLKTMRVGLKAANIAHTILGTSLLQRISHKMRDFSKNKIPLWSPSLPKPIRIEPNTYEQKASSKKVVYFSSCINRTMGQAKYDNEQELLFDVTMKLLGKAGFEVIFPQNLENLCCGMPFASKGFKTQGNQKAKELETALIEASENGAYPILCDTSPCAKRMIESFKSKLEIFEPIEFALQFLIPALNITKTDEPIVIHTTCSSRKMNLHERFIELANICSNEVIVPQNVKCCGFAGDRGFNFPELNKSALRDLKASIPADVKWAFSTSKTCEIGLSNESGIHYNSIFYLINRCAQ